MDKHKKKVELEDAIKQSNRIAIIFGGLQFGAIFGLVAYWLHSFDGWITFIYWFFSVMAFMAVIRGVWVFVTGKTYINMIAVFWLAFFLNIFFQVVIIKG